jgi:ferritin-like metal-binding protein YciE
MTHHDDHHQDDAATGRRRESARKALIAGLRNAHALERQAVSVMETQLGRLGDYPDLHARLTEHIRESREQGRRLEGALEDCGASASLVKDALMSAMGLGQSSVQGFADDAVLKAMLADTMFEHLEIAAYRSLFTLADMAEAPEVRTRLQPSLDEEIAMAAWLEENLDPVTRRYVDLSGAANGGGKAEAQAEGGEADPNATPWYAKPPPGSAAVVTQRQTPADEPETATVEPEAGGGVGMTPDRQP